ncbi:MAG TPA: TPM domain-containing protein, partial [Rariglobus sp.]
AAAELRTSGELRVVVHPSATATPLDEAAREFARLGMHRTRERNTVLLLVAPRSRTFAFYGDTGIHEKCGPAFWQELADALSADFRRDAFTDGIVAALTKAGDLLATHFPRRPDDRNELPDHVVERPPVV